MVKFGHPMGFIAQRPDLGFAPAVKGFAQGKTIPAATLNDHDCSVSVSLQCPNNATTVGAAREPTFCHRGYGR